MVEVSLGADKNVPPHVVADAAANVYQEVVAAGVAGAEVDAVAGRLETIETSGLPPDAAHEIKAGPLAHAWLVQAVEREQNGAEGDTKSRVVSLSPSPCRLKVEADPFVEDYVAADARIQASLFGHKTGTGNEGARGRPRGQERSEAKHGICLLRPGEASQQKGRSECCEQR